MPTYCRSTSSSKAITSSASSGSRFSKASIAPRSARRTSSPSSTRVAWIVSISTWSVTLIRLIEASGDVVLSPLVAGLSEDLLGRVVLDEDPRPLALLAALDAEERGHVGDSRRLLHVVRDDDDRVLLLQLVHQVLDRVVAIGSSAEAGSSIRITSGSTARQRAMQSRCCWPPERLSALFFSR